MAELDSLKNAIENWNKMEGASSVYLMYGWGKSKKDDKETEEASEKSENSEEEEHRNVTQGNRNAKYLKKARFYADTPQSRLKKQRTELKKELKP